MRVYLAGGVPEVMLHLRRAGLLDTSVKTVSGQTLDSVLDWWEASERRTALRARLLESDGVEADAVILSPDRAAARGLTPTVCFLRGNLAPGGRDLQEHGNRPGRRRKRRRVPAHRRWRACSPASARRLPPSRATATTASLAGEVMVLICRGPMGAGMEEVYQVTSALKYLDVGKQVALVTDARFSGVSTGACIGHVGPEALAGGPIGKIRDGDRIAVVIDRATLEGRVDLVDQSGTPLDQELASRPLRDDLHPDPALPADTRLWAALQNASGGTWGGCVYDVDSIVRRLGTGSSG